MSKTMAVVTMAAASTMKPALELMAVTRKYGIWVERVDERKMR